MNLGSDEIRSKIEKVTGMAADVRLREGLGKSMECLVEVGWQLVKWR